MTLPTADFLDWVADRFVEVYGENPDVDFLTRLRSEAALARVVVSREVAVRKHGAERAFAVIVAQVTWIGPWHYDDEDCQEWIEEVAAVLVGANKVRADWKQYESEVTR